MTYMVRDDRILCRLVEAYLRVAQPFEPQLSWRLGIYGYDGIPVRRTVLCGTETYGLKNHIVVYSNAVTKIVDGQMSQIEWITPDPTP